jgi:hypothetical protein
MKFNFVNKTEAINHLETLLKRNDPTNKKILPYDNFKHLIKISYDFDIELEEIQSSLEGLIIKGIDVDYLNLIEELNRKLEIEFYILQGLVLDCFCEINEKNSQKNYQQLFQELYNERFLFDYEDFKQNLKLERLQNYYPLIFSSIYYENQFLKIHDHMKKRLNNSESPRKIDFSDFYNKSKLNARFSEVFDFIDFMSNLTCEFNPPLKVQPSIRSKTVSIGMRSDGSESSDKSRKSKLKNNIKKGSFLLTKKNSVSPRKSNAFLGLSFILAKKPFKKPGKSFFKKEI